MERNPQRGFTVAEILTALVVVAVLTAIAIPMWRAHVLRVHRAEARDALIALQSAQDGYFGRNARYATAAQLTAKGARGTRVEGSQRERVVRHFAHHRAGWTWLHRRRTRDAASRTGCRHALRGVFDRPDGPDAS
jgi:prepilin-type N-terminal cleavage/methylation domain-containing protein